MRLRQTIYSGLLALPFTRAYVTLAAELGEVDLDPRDLARLGQDACLRLDLLRAGHEDPFDTPRAEWVRTLHRWFDHYLFGVANGIQGEPRANRLLLKDTLEAEGFVNYAAEWWHYTYQPELFPDTYFDFPVATNSLGG